jgi:predicted O-linked N-acetylglucosamine transferase (SPINDLY family)
MQHPDPTVRKALHDMRAGRLAQALAALRAALARRPDDLDLMQMLALMLVQSGQHDEALVWLERAVAARPQAVGYRNNYANALMQRGRHADALAQWEQAVAIEPGYALGWLGVTGARLHLRDSQGAKAAAERGLALRPGWPQLTQQLMLALEAGGDVDGALQCAAASLQADARQPGVRSNALLLSNYSAAPAADIAALHRAFGQHHAVAPRPPRVQPLKGRALRLGILSGDLRTHSVAFFLEPLLRHLPANLQVQVFSLVTTPEDPTTRRLQGLVKTWHEVGAADDAALDQAIRQQRIDVLLELHGHTGGNRLVALGSKPAPVIVTALGYPNTTGHPAVDWRLVDSITDPPGSEALSTERLLRLDPCFLCYSPPPDSPAPLAPAPGARFTFGSFNALSKIGPQTMALWARVLQAVPGAQLLLKTTGLADPAARTHLLTRLVQAGIAADRVELLPATRGLAEHLAVYARMHAALDTTPYNGTTTTCEALWMGVPVLCLEGDRHASRVGASLLQAIGRSDLLARTTEEFVQTAVQLAARPHTEAERLALRARMAASPLMDGPAYAQRVVQALRGCFEAA